VDKFKEYQFLAQSTQHLSDRRQAITQTYLTVNTAIFALLALTLQHGELKRWFFLLTIVPLFTVGVMAGVMWLKMIGQYTDLIRWRYDQLMAMEQSMPECHQVYRKEWKSFASPRKGKEAFGFSQVEMWLPRLFIILYLVYGIGLIVAMLYYEGASREGGSCAG
jgi:hypothetical protein